SGFGSIAELLSKKLHQNVAKLILHRCSCVQLGEIWLHSPLVFERRPFASGVSLTGQLREEPSMKRWFVLLIATLCLGVASTGGAQIATGNIYGTVADAQGGVLPGATVSVVAKSIGGAPRTTVSDTGGQFRFLNLDAATYTVTVELPGFTKQA